MEGIREIRAIYDSYDYPTQILAASSRSPLHIRDAALAGADVCTMPFDLYQEIGDCTR